MSGFDLEHANQVVPFFADLGVVIERAADGICSCSMPVTTHVINANGTLHGGIIFTLLDTGMGVAAFTTLEPGERTATIECSIRYLRSVASGRITAHCHVVHRTNNIVSTHGEVFDGADELVAVAGGSYYISRSKT